jgi:endo-1,4-beta-xylanase
MQRDVARGALRGGSRNEVEEWIRLFCARYPDVDEIDVVNEPPPHTTPVYAEALGGAGSSGYDWIVQAFKWTRQYRPNATLILNDIEYGADQTQFTMFWNHPEVPGITLWGYVSGATWKQNTGLMSPTGDERPALRWLREFLGR